MKNTLDNNINVGSSRTIRRVVENGFCTGCGLCMAISNDKDAMKIGSEGYLRPTAELSEEPSIIKIFRDSCPGIKVKHDKPSQNIHVDAIWGPLHNVYVGNALDKDVHYRGSSGGVLSALSLYLLDSGQVDFVAHIGVSKESPLLNVMQMSVTKDDIIHAAGSRYAPSSPLAVIKEYLDTGKKFAFIGKPCDVAALRSYAKYEPRIAKQIPYMFSFMCAGMPSIHGTYKLLESLGADRNNLESFRYRGDGWPGMAKAVTKDGAVYETDYNSSWGNILGRYLQFRCKICPDGTGEFADVVCADAWYSKDGYPDFTERDGRSLIMTRSASGEALYQAAKAAGYIDADNIPASDIALMQPYQVTRKKLVLGRLLGTLVARGISPRYYNMGLIRASLLANPLEWLRNAWGTFRRAHGEKI